MTDETPAAAPQPPHDLGQADADPDAPVEPVPPASDDGQAAADAVPADEAALLDEDPPHTENPYDADSVQENGA